MCNLCICKCRIAFSKIMKNKDDGNQLSASMEKGDNFKSESCINYKNNKNEMCLFDNRQESKHTLYQKLLKISLIDHVDSLCYIEKAFFSCEENLCFTILLKSIAQQRIEKIIKKHHEEHMKINFGLNLSLETRAEYLFDFKGNILLETPTPVAVSTPMLIRKIPSISRITAENEDQIKNIKRKLIF